MAEKINLEPGLTLRPSHWVNLESMTKLINGHIFPKFKGSDDADTLLTMKIGRNERVLPSTPDLRMVVRIQRKNKHPHSTKKHK